MIRQRNLERGDELIACGRCPNVTVGQRLQKSCGAVAGQVEKGVAHGGNDKQQMSSRGVAQAFQPALRGLESPRHTDGAVATHPAGSA